MKYIKTIKTIVLLLSTCFAFAQELPNILPPSPEAASVFKSTEIPVSLHTGVPNISVPLFEIKTKGVSIPITINYNSRGIQVSEIASRVGMGWSLNYGGMISRQIRGKADEDGYGYLTNISSTNSFFTDYATRVGVYNTYVNVPDYDFTPDQFFYNVNNLSGKFVLDQRDGKAVIQKFSNIKIDYANDGKIKSFIVIDDNGNKYYFGYSKDGSRFAADRDRNMESISYPEIGSPFINNTSQDSFYNTWHLMTIETNAKELIEFYYQLESTVHYRRSFDEPEDGLNTYISHFSKIISDQYNIQEIQYNQGKIVFTNSLNAREDLRNGTYIKEITLYDKLNTKIKGYTFKYSYKVSANDNNQLNYLKTIEPESSKRLFLDQLYEKNNATDSLPGYTFTYSKTKLPNKHSNSQDYWGYYNGKNNGQFLKFYYAEVGSRAVDTIKSEAGLLKKITYPTGGMTTFEFEHNVVKNVFPNRLVFQSPNPLTDYSIFLTHLDYNTNYANGAFTKYFSVGDNLIGSLNYSVDFDDTTGCSASGNTFECKFLVSLKNLQTNITYQLFLGEHTANLSAGNYVLTVDPIDNNYDPIEMGNGFGVDLFWKEEIADPSQLLFAGGKRIKKIEYNENATNVSFVKTYNYSDTVTGVTSGYLFGLPSFYSLNPMYSSEGFQVYEPYGAVPGSVLSTYQGSSIGYETVTEYFGENNNNTGKSMHKFSMTPDTGLYYEFPYHLPTDNEWLRGQELEVTHFKKQISGYAPVKKIENKYLYGDYLFEEEPGVEPHSTPAIFNPIPIEKFLTENMTVESLKYLKNERIFRLPIPIFNKKDTIVTTVSVHPITGDTIRTQTNQERYTYKTYHLTGGTVDLLSSKITDYLENEVVETTTTYDYDYNEHYNLAKTTNTNSLGEILETQYYYPLDSEMSTKPVVNDLKNKNMVGMPLVVQSYNGTEKTSEVETIYKNWNNTLLAPEIIKTSNGALALENRVKYNLVDDTNGNPLEVQQEDGIPITYIWGYNKTQPIAKIENATYAQVQQYEANLQTLSNGTNETNLNTALDNLRAALPNAMVTTYTYKPSVGVSTITDPKGNRIS
ncbi:hypothetical protein, partial [Flavobacterium sp. NRK F7]|uniref:hypothetical protein n=1 Tax=Flavobacterium sp. NRK F7 TaxID=2954930 RepID=UPI0020909701